MEYEEKKSWTEYLYFLNEVWVAAREKLIPGGRFAINIANVGRNPYVPLASFMTKQLLDLGMVPEGEIIWVKPVGSQTSQSSFGSWRLPSNPSLSDRHEYILIFRKDERRRNLADVPLDLKNQSILSKEDFLKYRSSIWEINPVPKNGHPCPYPLELPLRLIQLYSFVGDVILDPFTGSGTTAWASKSINRHFIGYEIIKKYVDLALQKSA